MQTISGVIGVTRRPKYRPYTSRLLVLRATVYNASRITSATLQCLMQNSRKKIEFFYRELRSELDFSLFTLNSYFLERPRQLGL